MANNNPHTNPPKAETTTSDPKPGADVINAHAEAAHVSPKAETPPAVEKPPTPKVKEKSAKELRVTYDKLLIEVQKCQKDGKVYEQKLQEEVKAKVKARAGDLEDLQRQKRAAFAAWEAAERKERDDAERAKATTLKS